MVLNKPEIREIRENTDISEIMKRPFLTPKEICILLEVSLHSAYAIINDLNAELKQKGFYTRSARVSTKFFADRFNLEKGTQDKKTIK